MHRYVLRQSDFCQEMQHVVYQEMFSWKYFGSILKKNHQKTINAPLVSVSFSQYFSVTFECRVKLKSYENSFKVKAVNSN
jgi:hypothetical protein